MKNCEMLLEYARAPRLRFSAQARLNRPHRYGGLLQACVIDGPLTLIAQTESRQVDIITDQNLYVTRLA